MTILGWSLIIILFTIGMAGTIYPILPGAVAVYAAFFVYGWFFSFEPFNAWFWSIETSILIMIFIADYLVNALGIKKFGGSKASIWGSTIGLLVGPFVIPFFGLILGPLIGAILGELTQRQTFGHAMKVGFGSVVSLFSSILVKVLLQLVMLLLFFLTIF